MNLSMTQKLGYNAICPECNARFLKTLKYLCNDELAILRCKKCEDVPLYLDPDQRAYASSKHKYSAKKLRLEKPRF